MRSSHPHSNHYVTGGGGAGRQSMVCKFCPVPRQFAVFLQFARIDQPFGRQPGRRSFQHAARFNGVPDVAYGELPHRKTDARFYVSIRPSCPSRSSASRIGVRETRKRAVMGTSNIRSPGLNSPRKTISRKLTKARPRCDSALSGFCRCRFTIATIVAYRRPGLTSCTPEPVPALARSACAVRGGCRMLLSTPNISPLKCVVAAKLSGIA